MKKFVIGTFLTLAGLASVTAQSLMQTLVVVKYTEPEAITVKELKDIVDNQEKEKKRALTPDERKDTLETLINQKLILQAAKKDGVTVQNSEIDQYFLASIAQQLGLNRIYSEKELNDYVMANKKMTFAAFLKEQTGMTQEQVKESVIKPDLIWQQYLLKLNQEEMNKISATKADIEKYYELNKATQFARPDSLKMFMVAVPKTEGKDPAQARAKLEKILSDYKSGKTTVEQLRVEGQNAEKSGFGAADAVIMKIQMHAAQLGISYDQLLKLFDESLNTPSEILDQPNMVSFHIILEKYPSKILDLLEPVRPDRQETVYETIRALLTRNERLVFLDQKRQEILKSLNTPENVQRKKTGDDLVKVLSW